jgi:UDP-N-acetylmuramate--alanine ligase
LVCVFQPHTHDRTLKLYDEFTRCFQGCDLLLICDVYEARKDIETKRVDLEKFVKDVATASRVQALSSGSLDHTKEMLERGILKPGDVLLFMGAGDITNLSRSMARASA